MQIRHDLKGETAKLRRKAQGASVSLQQSVEGSGGHVLMFGQYSCFHTCQCLTKAYSWYIYCDSNAHTTNVHTLLILPVSRAFLFSVVLVLYRIAERLLANKGRQRQMVSEAERESFPNV